MKSPLDKPMEFFDFPIPIVSFELAKLCKDQTIHSSIPPTSHLTKYYTPNGRIIHLGWTGKINIHTCYPALTIIDAIDYLRWRDEINIQATYYKQYKIIRLANNHIMPKISHIDININSYTRQTYYKLLNYYLFLTIHPDAEYSRDVANVINKLEDIFHQEKRNSITYTYLKYKKDIVSTINNITVDYTNDNKVLIIYKDVLITYKKIAFDYYLDSITFNY